MAQNNKWSLVSLRKGLNNTDPPHFIGDEQCTVAENVEFNLSTLGERRKGCVDVDLPTSITGDANMQAVTFLHRHLPTTVETASELWVLAQHLTSQFFKLVRKTTSWATATFTDDIEVTGNQGFHVAAQTLHGKLFLAYPSVGGVDRLHVVDASGTAVRRTGLAEPAAPTGANVGTPGTVYTGTRYFRQRYTVQDGSGKTLRRSEPSAVLTFVPSGAATGVRITKSATINESETHWELEASLDNANFYVIATTVVGTTTVDDSVAFSSGYAAAGYRLSEDIGDYALIPSGVFLTADDDRLIIAGSWEDSAKASRVTWTPVFGAEGAGNDERLETDTDPFVDLDGFEGGPITAMSRPVDGSIYVFKRSHTYRLRKTGIRSRAYDVINLSKSLGALPGSVVEGVDQYGMACLYFLDYETGPCRTGGQRAVQRCGLDIQNTWSTVNLNSIVTCRGVYYPETRQVHWWIATDDADFPNLKIVLQTDETEETASDGVRGGWSLATGTIAEAYTVCTYAENIDDNAARSLVLRPFIGVSAANGYVLRCDTGDDDNGTPYVATIRTKPFYVIGLLQKFGVKAAALLAKAHATARVNVTLIRDSGVEEPKSVETGLAPVGAESDVIKQMRNFVGSQMYCAQLEFADVDTPSGQWQLNRIDLKVSEEEGA